MEPKSAAAVEVHSIDYIPESERHGRPWYLGPLWFMAIAELATLAVGPIGIAVGGNLFWSLVAIVLGALIGTFFMAFHSVQGPRLGLPQMIQSRPQFGYYGALVPQVMVLFLYVGFAVFSAVVGGQALQFGAGLGAKPALAVVLVLSLVVALVGHDLIHLLQRWGTYLFLACFGVFTVGLLATIELPAGALDPGAFSLTPFLVMFGVTAAYQLSIAPYVSDYSRYLPADSRAGAVFGWTYGGSVLGGVWLIGLGALLAAGHPDLGPVEAVRAGADQIFSGFGRTVLLVGVVGMVGVVAINLYGGSLVAIGMADTVKPVRATVRTRFAGIGLVFVASTLLALLVSEDFLASYNNFLVLVLYFLTPWTSVNLVDYYLVRRGHYVIQDVFDPNGIYGKWGWRGQAAYFGGFAVMIPFFSTTWFTGPVASALDGADISIFVGLAAAAIIYGALTRNLDLVSERAAAAAGPRPLEAEQAGA